MSLWLHFFPEKARTAFFIREKNKDLQPFLWGFSIHLQMYVFVTKIIILVVVILGNLPLSNALEPAWYYDCPSQGQRDKKKLTGQKTNCFFIDHKIGEKGHTQPFLRKEISKRTTHQRRATSVSLKSRQALNTVQ